MELNTTNDTSSVEAVTRSAGSLGLTDRDPGAHAPGFMLSCATRTVLLKNRKIASLTPVEFFLSSRSLAIVNQNGRCDLLGDVRNRVLSGGEARQVRKNSAVLLHVLKRKRCAEPGSVSPCSARLRVPVPSKTARLSRRASTAQYRNEPFGGQRPSGATGCGPGQSPPRQTRQRRQGSQDLIEAHLRPPRRRCGRN